MNGSIPRGIWPRRMQSGRLGLAWIGGGWDCYGLEGDRGSGGRVARAGSALWLKRQAESNLYAVVGPPMSDLNSCPGTLLLGEIRER